MIGFRGVNEPQASRDRKASLAPKSHDGGPTLPNSTLSFLSVSALNATQNTHIPTHEYVLSAGAICAAICAQSHTQSDFPNLHFQSISVCSVSPVSIVCPLSIILFPFPAPLLLWALCVCWIHHVPRHLPTSTVFGWRSRHLAPCTGTKRNTTTRWTPPWGGACFIFIFSTLSIHPPNCLYSNPKNDNWERNGALNPEQRMQDSRIVGLREYGIRH